MTITQMANTLGLSVTTVSRALAGKGRISEETRQKVIAFAQEQKRREQSEGKKTGNLGVILPADVYSCSEPYFQECLLGICETASVMGYDVLIATATANDISGIHTLVEKKKVDGVILTRSVDEDKAVQYLTQAGFPVALTGTIENSQVIQADANNEEAAQTLTSFLIGEGYRKFALITENLEFTVNRRRYNGFCKALEKNGLDKNKQAIYMNNLTGNVMDSVIHDLFAQRIECILCSDDVICTRIMSNLQASGYRIPRDIAVASFYNSPNLNCFMPPITTVHISAKKIGNTICMQLINSLQGKEYHQRTGIDYEILVRKSTKKVGEKNGLQ